MKCSIVRALCLFLSVLMFCYLIERIICLYLESSILEQLNGEESQNVRVTKAYTNKTGEILYSLHAFGEDLKLVLKKSDQLVTPEATIIKRHNGRTISQEKIAGLGYHTGFIHSKPGSSLAVKVKDDYLSGVIITDSNLMTINGYTGEPTGNGLRHVITRRKQGKNVSEEFGFPVFKQSPGRKSTLHKRSVADNRYLEVMIVADNYTTDFYGNFTEQYLMSVAYLTNAVMQDDSIGAIKVILTVVKLMVISGHEKGLDLYENNVFSSLSYLHVFATWVKQFNKPDDTDSDHFDQGLLISRRVCGLRESCSENGRGYLGQMCSASQSVASSTAAGLSSALTVAHETGHNFGLGHDSQDCARGYIMHATLSSGGNAFKWSHCSRHNLQAWFNDKDKFSCLLDVPSNSVGNNDVSVVHLASNYSGDEQCRLMYGSSYIQCGPLKSNCGTLYCMPTDATYCIHRGVPPLEGTNCGTYKWCRGGECVDQPIPPPTDGNWGAWSTTLSQCTRSCGMGVRYRTRNCDNPPAAFFGKPCLGDSKGHFETCNTQDCPSGTPSFRLEQCQEESSSYTDYYEESAKCRLACRSGSMVYYFGTVKDGTLCSKYLDIYDVCVLGKCTEVGCDRNLLSRKYFDRCRVCGGDGSTCKLVNETYSIVHTLYGEANAAVMFTLPTGATNLVVKETEKSWNEIGVKDEADNWVIGPGKFSTVKYLAGTRIMYDREESQYAETITILGPTTQPLKIMFIYFYERNRGIPYHYYKPMTSPDPSPISFIWKYTMSECSQTCAGGVQQKIVKCYRADDNSEVGIEHCDQATEPSGSVPCNIQPCDPSWQISTWSQCSAPCGPLGKRTRSIQCIQKVNNTEDRVLADDQCKEPKDTTEEECNRKDCEPDWEPGEWSECSRKKCEGTQTRELHCKKLLVSGVKESRSDSECTKDKPITELRCNTGIRCYEWKPVYPSCAQCEDPETFLSYKEIGCYKMNNKLFGPMLKDLRNSLDPSDKSKTVAECGLHAWKRARRIFAVGNGGVCYSSMNGHETYNRDGRSSKCVDNIGGDGEIFVYAINGKVLVAKQTCFHVENDSVVDSSNCEDGNPLPNPEIKLCCEEICKDYCFKTEDGGYCSIPFIYKGRTYYDCIENQSGKLWCSTTSNHDIDGQWAYCKEPCRNQTTSGQCCSFPFIYRGRIYNTCITSRSERPWCALTSNYDLDRRKGTCV